MLGNTKESYGWLAIALHWISAVGVILMFYFGLQAAGAQDAGDRAARGMWMGLHISTGATFLVFFAARIIQHYAQPQPVKPPQASWLNMLANVTQNLLLIALAIQIVSGPLAVWSGGRDINVWGAFAIPSPFAERNNAVHEAAELAHWIGRATILFILPVHVAGALKHVFVDRDGTFRRMLYPSKLKT